MRHRITLETEEVGLLVSALETQRQNVLDEVLAEGIDQDDLVEGAAQVRQLDSAIRKLTKVVVEGNSRRMAQEVE